MVLLQTVVLTILLRISDAAQRIPSDIKRCDIQDTVCFEEQFNTAIKNHKDGIPTLGVPSIDPLKISKIEIHENNEGKPSRPIRLDLDFNDVDITGISECKVSDVKGFDRMETGTKNKIELIMKGPKILLSGKYEMNGKILILPVAGTGDCQLNFRDFQIKLSFTSEAVERNGKNYILVENAKANIQVSRLIYKFDNLFNGDQRLSEQMNKFLNQNWKEIFQELKPSIDNTFANIIEQVLNNVLNNVPLNELFIQN